MNRGVNEWGDPHPIIEEDAQLDSEKQKRVEIEQAISDSYSETFRTTPLDSRYQFLLQWLDEIDDDSTPHRVYRFQVRRFNGFHPAGTFTGVVHWESGEWVVSFDERDGFLSRIFTILFK